MDPGSAEEVLRRIEGSIRRWYLPIISGERARVLVEVVRRFRPKRILEVGTFVGYSAILMGRELGPDSEIVTIEIDEDEADRIKENIRDSGIEPRVEVTGDALELIPQLEGNSIWSSSTPTSGSIKTTSGSSRASYAAITSSSPTTLDPSPVR